VLTLARAVSAGRWRGWSHELYAAAASGNQVAVLLMLQSDAEVQFDAVKLAAAAAGCKSVQLSTLQWICGQHDAWVAANVVTLCLNAAAADATDTLDWLSKNMSCCTASLRASSIVEAGVQAGSLNALRWLAKAGVQLNNMNFTDCASRAAQYSVLRYLVSEQRCPWNQQLARERAAAAGTADS
jgi:Tfp pilus assembly major pilin PilA